MKLLLAFTAFCLGVAMADVDTSECRIIKGDPSFKFDDFAGSEYSFAAGTGSSKLPTWSSGNVATLQVNDLNYVIYTTNNKDLSQDNVVAIITENDGASMHQVVLDNGQQSDREFIITVYGYKANAYLQFYVCGEKTATGDDLRFTLTYGSYKLTTEDWRKIALNDKSNRFTGSLVKIGTSAKIADTNE